MRGYLSAVKGGGVLSAFWLVVDERVAMVSLVLLVCLLAVLLVCLLDCLLALDLDFFYFRGQL